MKIETTHEVEVLNARDARLVVHVVVDGVRMGSPIVVASGPETDIEAYVSGKITLDDLSHRILGCGLSR